MISILTFYNAENYGAVLQTIALQEKVAEISQNEDVYVVTIKSRLGHFTSERVKKKYPLFWILLAGYRFIKRTLFSKQAIWDSVKSKMNLVSWEDAQKGRCVIVGSDQVWNHNFVFERENFFFLNLQSEKINRLSYAASIGVDEWPEWFKRKCIPLLKKFNHISVRELSAKRYLGNLGFSNVELVCDPTVLHKGDFFRRKFHCKKTDEDFVYVYRLRELLPKSVQGILGKNIREVYLKDDSTIVPVNQWLENIDNSKCVVTDSFHGVVFCVLFHKPFLVIPNNSNGKGMNERFATLLGKIHLEYRFLTCQETTVELLEKLNKPIDWNSVDLILEEWRNYSIEWLKNALGK